MLCPSLMDSVGLAHLLQCTDETMCMSNLHVHLCLMTGCWGLTVFVY